MRDAKTMTTMREAKEMHGSGVKRAVRVAEQVREEIAVALARDLRDPRLAYAVITRVHMPDDLGLAKIMVRLATGGDDQGARARLLAALRASSGLLRRRVGKNLGLRRAPELRFEYDEGLDAYAVVDELLAEIARENGKRG
jgi:ribosome-binding factor A